MTTSVVVPVYNDPEGLTTTVESLLDQTATDYEIVIADNGSTDDTARVAREFATTDRVRRVVEDEIQSSYAARNAGIDAADGDVIGFVDADMWVEDDYVAAITERMGDRSYMGCRVELVGDDSTVARYRRATGFPVEKYVTEAGFAPTCCLVVHRRLLDEIGDFDARLVSNGDLEFGRRASEAGFELTYEPEIPMYHPARSTLRAVLAQNVRIGHGREQIRRFHGDRFEVRAPTNPRNYLPVNPVGFLDSLDASGSAVERPLWYGLACVQKWARTAGYLRARRRDAVYAPGYQESG
ncbi:glycosyltransferase [Haloplanus sp. C73]|uniref:glycosyltransferase n=1 Tax=Haloplanus sp. C73 TaxID=3421641 RepID=UPI003EC0111A